MRVTLDGKPAACLKSSSIAHATKSRIELGVAGKDGWFDDIKIWDAEPVKRRLAPQLRTSRKARF